MVLPRPPEPPPRHPFPLLASLAPVIGSLVIWAITSSPFALVFAFLGPVIAVGTLVDGRIHGTRALSKDRIRFAREVAAARDAIAAAHAFETGELRRSNPGALDLAGYPGRDPERWRTGLDEPANVVIGWAMLASDLRIEGALSGQHGEAEPQLVRLHAAGLTVRAPVVVDARLGIGIVGSPVACMAVARGLALQLAARLPPETAECGAPLHDGDWAAILPHQALPMPGEDEITWSDPGGSASIWIARNALELPHSCRVVVELSKGEGARVVAHPDRRLLVMLETEAVSLAQASEIATTLARLAEGRRSGLRSLPPSVCLAEIAAGPAGGALSADFLVGVHGAITVDLASHGPHAVVAGTTGSGKSELLLSWLLAIALRVSPADVNFLLVDFKGGASFGPITLLPHVVGLVTDLDERSAHRALSSLTAEVRTRERILATAGARSIDELGEADRLPRLVIVVDEFAALVSGFAELHELFADLAARGRSLGVHLVLCTQRPAGVVRDSVLANAQLRLSLRVNNRADSTAVIGTDAAAALPVNPPGRALISFAGADPITVQVALAESADVDRAISQWQGGPAPRRPWCDELAAHIALDDLESTDSGFTIGRADLPQQQLQSTASWSPELDGNLLVLGAAGSGKSQFLALLLAQGAVAVAGGIEGLWDAVAGSVEKVRLATAEPVTLLIDDLDALVSRLGDDHEPAFVDLLVELLRTGSAAGVTVVVAARRVPARLQTIAASCDSRLVLRQQNRQEHLLAGGDPTLFDGNAPAGRGEWHGAALQVAFASHNELVESRPGGPPPVFMPTGPTLVVTPRAKEFAVRYPDCLAVVVRAGDRGGPAADELGVHPADRPTLFVADPDAWQANWQLLSELRSTATMIFDRCSVADFRAITGNRQLPPPIEPGSSSAWLFQPGGSPRRVRFARESE